MQFGAQLGGGSNLPLESPRRMRCNLSLRSRKTNVALAVRLGREPSATLSGWLRRVIARTSMVQVAERTGAAAAATDARGLSPSEMDLAMRPCLGAACLAAGLAGSRASLVSPPFQGGGLLGWVRRNVPVGGALAATAAGARTLLVAL